MGFSDEVKKIVIDEMDLKNKSDNHIPIFQSSWTTLVMR